MPVTPVIDYVIIIITFSSLILTNLLVFAFKEKKGKRRLTAFLTLGKQERTVECSRTDDGSYLGDDSCLKKSNKPAAERSCNNHPCHPE